MKMLKPGAMLELHSGYAKKYIQDNFIIQTTLFDDDMPGYPVVILCSLSAKGDITPMYRAVEESIAYTIREVIK